MDSVGWLVGGLVGYILHMVRPSLVRDHPQPHSQTTPSCVPRPPPASFPDHTQLCSQTTPSLIPRPHPAVFPDHPQPHSQTTPSCVPRPHPASFSNHTQLDYIHTHSQAMSTVLGLGFILTPLAQCYIQCRTWPHSQAMSTVLRLGLIPRL